MKIDVIEIVKTDSIFIIEQTLLDYQKCFLNGEEISTQIKRKGLIINKDDKLQFLPSNKTLTHYKRGDEFLSIKEFNSKPQSYNDKSTDEQVLHAIANKKELEGFEAVYEDSKLEDIELNIVGFLDDTGSEFIKGVIQSRYSSDKVLYTVYGKEIAMDEYKANELKYKNIARFYLEEGKTNINYAKINGNYCFNNVYYCGDQNYISHHTTLEEAKEQENKIRSVVRVWIKRAIDGYPVSHYNISNTLVTLKNIKKMKTKKTMDELIDVAISNIEEYFNLLKY